MNMSHTTPKPGEHSNNSENSKENSRNFILKRAREYVDVSNAIGLTNSASSKLDNLDKLYQFFAMDAVMFGIAGKPAIIHVVREFFMIKFAGGLEYRVYSPLVGGEGEMEGKEGDTEGMEGKSEKGDIPGGYQLLSEFLLEQSGVVSDDMKQVLLDKKDCDNSVVFGFKRYWNKINSSSSSYSSNTSSGRVFVSAIEYITFDSDGLIKEIDYIATPGSEQQE